MSILLHGAKSLNQILLQEKRVNRDDFGTLSEEKKLKKDHFKGEMLTTLSNWASFYAKNLQSYVNVSKKGLIWQNCMFSKTFCPNLHMFFTRIYPSYP